LELFAIHHWYGSLGNGKAMQLDQRSGADFNGWRSTSIQQNL
jgi:hypothetical protein